MMLTYSQRALLVLFPIVATANPSFDWAVKAISSGNDQGQAIASDGEGGALVTGYYGSTISFGSTSVHSAQGSAQALFVARVDSTGTFTWAAAANGISGSSAYGKGIVSDGAGGG
jgi:hypothetical protein